MNAVSRALRAARGAAGLDQEAFSELLDVDVADVRAWEAGQRDAGSRALIRCARELALSVEELLTGKLEHASMPSLFLRAKDHQGDLLRVSSDLAAFVDVARSVARLRALREDPVAVLPAPPVDAQWGTGAPPYRADELAAWMRRELAIDTPDVPSMREVYRQLGIAIVWADAAEASELIDGASLLSPRPTVLVHLIEGKACWWRTRMTLAHELCHLLCDFADERRDLALVSPTNSTGDSEAAAGSKESGRHAFRLFKDFAWVEQRASAFASHFLVPDEPLRSALAKHNPLSEDAVTTVCSTFGVGRITAVSRIKHAFKLSEDRRLDMLRRPHEERHTPAHSDVAPERSSLRGGVLLDEVAIALADGAIDRVEAHLLLRLELHEPLPAHPRLTDAQRAPLRSVEDDVRDLVSVALLRERRTGLYASDVRRGEDGWYVGIADHDSRRVEERRVSFDLDCERAALSA